MSSRRKAPVAFLNLRARRDFAETGNVRVLACPKLLGKPERLVDDGEVCFQVDDSFVKVGTEPLALALLVSKRFRGVSIFRTMYFSPQLTSMVVISVLWTVLYNSNPNTGLINSILVSFGLQPINFLTNAKTAMNAIIFMSAWQGAGYQMMIFLAGLQGIPTEQYEASAVDGANKWQQFWNITIPNLKGTIKYVIMITMIQAMKLFTQPYVMTQGGPKNATKTMVYYIYTQGFQKGNFGYACSVAAVFFVIVVAMSLILQRITNAD